MRFLRFRLTVAVIFLAFYTDIESSRVEQQPASEIVGLAFECDFLFLDTAQATTLMVESAGATRYLGEAVCMRVLRGRRDDVHNPLHILKYTPGHYEGVIWPRAGELG